MKGSQKHIQGVNRGDRFKLELSSALRMSQYNESQLTIIPNQSYERRRRSIENVIKDLRYNASYQGNMHTDQATLTKNSIAIMFASSLRNIDFYTTILLSFCEPLTPLSNVLSRDPFRGGIAGTPACSSGS